MGARWTTDSAYHLAMHRKRVPLPCTREYASVSAFLLARPRQGSHAIAVGSEWIDVSYTDRGAPVTLVCFHSALTERVLTVPAFSGTSVAEQAGINLIAVADPSIATGEVDLGWFLGTRGMGHLRPRLSPVIQHLLGDRRAILFGASGGGYAATLYGGDFPGHSVVAVNPRLDLTARPAAKLSDYLRVAHKVRSSAGYGRAAERFVPPPLKELYADGLPFDLHLLQNANDRVYRQNQTGPFVDALGADERLHVHLYDGEAGHRPIGSRRLVPYLQQVAANSLM